MAEIKRVNQYVVGFLFSHGGQYMALIEEGLPGSQTGKWNGASGRVDSGELPKDAVRRQFLEQTGVDHFPWIYVCTIRRSDGEARVFAGQADKPRPRLLKLTDEQPAWIFWEGDFLTNGHALDHLQWLVPMCWATLNGCVQEGVIFFDEESV